jgi:tRNA-dihydrouridine synthase 4
MILADSFIYSNLARDMEYQICQGKTKFHIIILYYFAEDKPVVIQFAARNAFEFANAAELAAPYADGIDLNCGCPQRWAIQEGIGAKLMHVDPEHLKDMIRQARGRTVDTPVSVKIRIYDDRRRTVELARQLESVGASWVTVHGRRKDQKPSESIDPESIKLVKETISIPVIANGNIFTREQAEELHLITGANGIMSARGLLENPALFAGFDKTPWEAVQKYVELAITYGSCHAIMHHHLVTMMQNILPNSSARHFNTLTSIPSIIDYINDHLQ